MAYRAPLVWITQIRENPYPDGYVPFQVLKLKPLPMLDLIGHEADSITWPFPPRPLRPYDQEAQR